MSADFSGTPYTPIDEPKKDNKKTIIIIVVVLVLLCCCCVAGVLLAWNFGDQVLNWFNGVTY